jgi:hypothetical protein
MLNKHIRPDLQDHRDRGAYGPRVSRRRRKIVDIIPGYVKVMIRVFNPLIELNPANHKQI